MSSGKERRSEIISTLDLEPLEALKRIHMRSGIVKNKLGEHQLHPEKDPTPLFDAEAGTKGGNVIKIKTQ